MIELEGERKKKGGGVDESEKERQRGKSTLMNTSCSQIYMVLWVSLYFTRGGEA